MNHEAFLSAIRAEPDDDFHRLVYADWLDERGDPLGEFIRLQIELEPLRGPLAGDRSVRRKKGHARTFRLTSLESFLCC